MTRLATFTENKQWNAENIAYGMLQFLLSNHTLKIDWKGRVNFCYNSVNVIR
jgi:hypothetical protein